MSVSWLRRSAPQTAPCGVQAGLQQASPEEQAFRAAYRMQLSSRLSPARDSDGFRKLLLVRFQTL